MPKNYETVTTFVELEVIQKKTVDSFFPDTVYIATNVSILISSRAVEACNPSVLFRSKYSLFFLPFFHGEQSSQFYSY